MERQALFLELLTANHARWRGIARAYARQETEDLFQEILLQVWRSLSIFHERSSISTWAYRVALNTAMSWRRSEQTRRRRLPIRPGYDPGLVASPSAEARGSESLDRVLAGLNPTDKAILLLYLDEVGYDEMAEILGSTAAALRVRVHRIKTRAAEILGTEAHGT
jgi:RNA polymerase sigma-70 factor (ECF subfamily)